MNFIAVFIGGGLGSITRYGVSRLLSHYHSAFPLATLISNVLSSIILACLVFFFLKKMPDNKAFILFAMTGFCGGFSTFSTFSLETFELIKSGNLGLAVINVLISVGICVLLIYAVYKMS